MSVYIGVDPAPNSSGVALISGNRVIWSGTYPDPDALIVGLRSIEAQLAGGAIEIPEKRGSLSKVRTCTLIELGVVSGCAYATLYGRCSVLKRVTPSTWKGQVPKHVTANRVKRAFPGFIPPGNQRQKGDIYDAVGLAMYARSLCE